VGVTVTVGVLVAALLGVTVTAGAAAPVFRSVPMIKTTSYVVGFKVSNGSREKSEILLVK
jgi:hypothetical protein